jgi:exonuclease III
MSANVNGPTTSDRVDTNISMHSPNTVSTSLPPDDIANVRNIKPPKFITANCKQRKSYNTRFKMDEILLRTNTYRPHIFVLQLTKLNNNTELSSLVIPDCKFFRRDRTEHGGGVALYISDTLKPIEIVSRVTDNLEAIAAKCKLKSFSIAVMSVYRPPRCVLSEFLDALGSFIASLGDLASRVIIAGDTNVCSLLPESKLLMNSAVPSN